MDYWLALVIYHGSHLALRRRGLDNMTFIGHMTIPSSAYTADRPRTGTRCCWLIWFKRNVDVDFGACD